MSASTPASRSALLLAALTPAAVLACDPGGLFPFGPAKWLAVSAFVPAGAAVLWWRQPIRFATLPTLAVTGLAMAMLLAATVGEEPLYAWTGTPERHLGVVAWVLVAVAFVAGQSLADERDQRAAVAAALIAGMGLGGFAVVEALDAAPHTLDAGSRLGGTFGSAAYLGAATALLLPLAVGVAVDRSFARPWRVAATGAVLTLAVATVGSGARAGWVGLAVAAGITAILNRRRLPGRRPLAIAATIAIPALGLLAVASPAGDRLADAFDADSAGGQGRLDEWRVAVNVLREHPVTGVGPEGYRVAAPEGIDAAYEDEHGRDPLPDRAHSAPLDIALAGGPLALLAWVALLVGLVPFVRRALTGHRPWLAGAAAGLVAYAVGELLLFPLAELEPVALLLAGVVVAASARRDDLRARRVPRLLPLFLGFVALAAVAAGVLELAADRQADQAAEALSAFDTSAGVAHAERAVDRRPDILRNHLLLAAALEADQQGIVAALAAVDEGLDVSPGDPIALQRRAELLVERAANTLVPAHIDTARAELAARLADDPNNSALWMLAGFAAYLDGDADEARAAFRRAGRLTPDDPRPAVALLQLELGELAERVAAEVGTG